MPHEASPIQAVVAGHLCLDLHPAFIEDGERQIKNILVPGKLINMGNVAISTGGATSNTGIALRLLGFETRIMGKIGKDYIGEGVQRFLQPYGVADGLIVDPEASTSYSIVISPPGIDRMFLHHPGANDTFKASDLDLGLIARARLFHFGYPPLMRLMYEDNGAELLEIYRQVKAIGTTTSLDLALPDPVSPAGQADWMGILRRVLPYTDVCVPSLEELLYMLDRPLFDKVKALADGKDILPFLEAATVPALADRLLDMGVKVAVIKLGRFGFYVRTAGSALLSGIGPARPASAENWGGRELWAGAYRVERILSTCGAGDASIAGFLAGLLSGQDIETTVNLACAVAGLKIQVETSFGGVLPLPEVLSRLPGWAKAPMDPPRSRWSFQESDKLWYTARDSRFAGKATSP